MTASEVLRLLVQGFGLRDQVSVSELRGSAWLDHLRQRHKLRVVARSEPVGVVLDAAVWEALEGLIQMVLEDPALGDRLEDLQIEALWGDRLTHHRGPASEEGQRLLQHFPSDHV